MSCLFASSQQWNDDNRSTEMKRLTLMGSVLPERWQFSDALSDRKRQAWREVLASALHPHPDIFSDKLYTHVD